MSSVITITVPQGEDTSDSFPVFDHSAGSVQFPAESLDSTSFTIEVSLDDLNFSALKTADGSAGAPALGAFNAFCAPLPPQTFSHKFARLKMQTSETSAREISVFLR